jgi:hypothetical protein
MTPVRIRRGAPAACPGRPTGDANRTPLSMRCQPAVWGDPPVRTRRALGDAVRCARAGRVPNRSRTREQALGRRSAPLTCRLARRSRTRQVVVLGVVFGYTDTRDTRIHGYTDAPGVRWADCVALGGMEGGVGRVVASGPDNLRRAGSTRLSDTCCRSAVIPIADCRARPRGRRSARGQLHRRW